MIRRTPSHSQSQPSPENRFNLSDAEGYRLPRPGGGTVKAVRSLLDDPRVAELYLGGAPDYAGNALVVAATGPNGRLASYSNRGGHVELAAPARATPRTA